MVGSFWVDDVALDGDDWFLTNATLLPSVASRRVSQLELFRGQGVRTAKGGWGLGSLTVDLVVPEGGTGSVASRLRRLQALLAGSSEIRAELDGLPVMACEVVGVDVSDPSRVGIEVWSLQAKFTLQPFWVEGEQVDPAVYAWSGMVSGSPSTETIGGVLNRTNAANNPRFTRTVGTVEVRRNQITDPRLLTTGALEDPSRGTLSRNAGGGVTVVQTSTTNRARFDFIKSAVVPLEKYTISFEVAGAHELVLYTNSWVTIPILANGVLGGRRWLTFDQPAGETAFRFGVRVDSLTVGSSVTIDRFLIETGATPKPYFDGSYSPDPDLTPVWVGTANASQSYLRGFIPGNTSANANFAVASQNNGMRLIPNSTASNESNASVGGTSSSLSGNGITFTPGKWYGFQAVCTLLAPQTGSLSSSARRMRLSSNNVAGWTDARGVLSNQPPNEAGSYQEELVTQLPADSVWAALYLYNGAYFGNGDVYWDKLLIVEGDTEEEARSKLAQGYFDGASDSGMTQSLTGTGTLTFTHWAGSTGVVRDGILRVLGAATSVSITSSDGTGLGFTQTLTASQCVFVDVERFRAWLGTATDWAETATAVPLDWPPAGPLVLKPSSDGVRLTVTGGTGLTLKGRRWWL